MKSNQRSNKNKKVVKTNKTKKSFVYKRSVPIATSNVVRNVSKLRIGEAPYHETFGSGMRVYARNLVALLVRDAATTEAKVLYTSVGSTSGYCDGLASSAVIEAYGTNATFGSAVCGPIESFGASMMRHFDKCNFREYSLEFVNECTYDTRGSAVIVPVFSSDITDRKQISSGGSYLNLAANPRAVEFSVKSPKTLVRIVNDRDLKKPASVLYDVDIESALLTPKQFYILAACTDMATTGIETVGRIYASYVMDLYGPHANPSAPVSAMFNTRYSGSNVPAQLTLSTAQVSTSSSSSAINSRAEDAAIAAVKSDYVMVKATKDEKKNEETKECQFRCQAAWNRP